MNEPNIHTDKVNESPTAHTGDDAGSCQSVERMFLEHYGLCEQPFGVTPDPRFLYLGPKHRQAMAALTYATESNRGFLTLIAKPGMGKTSLLFHYLENLRDKARTAFLFQTSGDSRELMRYVLADLGLDGAGKDLPEMHAILNRVLMEEMRAGRRFVLVIDEAQNLGEKVLESVRMLSNFETPWMKLMQIVLAGQPQLAERLAKPSMAQLRQRVSFAIRIEPLTREEVAAYVDHRLWVAGHRDRSPFSVGALTLIAERSEGIPRNINNVCFCAMSLGWATKQKAIDREMVLEVLADLGLDSAKATIDFTPKAPFAPKPTLAPKHREEPKPSISQNHRAGVLTIKEPPARSWWPKGFFAGAVLFVLGWYGLPSDIGKRVEFYTRGKSDTEKRSLVPASVPVSLASAAVNGRN